MFWHSPFRRLIGKLLGPFLSQNGFARAGRIRRKYYEAYVFQSARCKIGFYDSPREGEVNCMLAPPSAPNTLNEADGWRYIYALQLHGANPTLEQLQARVPKAPRSRESQLSDIANVLRNEYKRLLSVLKTSG